LHNTIDEQSYRNVFNPQLPIASDLKSGTANKSSFGNSYRISVKLSMVASNFGASLETYFTWSKRSASANTYTGLSPELLPAVVESNPLMTNATICVEIGGVSTKMSRIFCTDELKSFFVPTWSAIRIVIIIKSRFPKPLDPFVKSDSKHRNNRIIYSKCKIIDLWLMIIH